MNFEKLTDGTEVNGTSLQGFVETTYEELVDIFGEPSLTYTPEELEKTQAEWWLLFSDGTIATIYDWKRYNSPVEGCTEWNIGGMDNDAEFQVKQRIKETRDISAGTLFDNPKLIERYVTTCKKCGCSDLSCGWDVMVPLNKEPLELQDFLDGEYYTDYIWCNVCDEEATETEEVIVNAQKNTH